MSNQHATRTSTTDRLVKTAPAASTFGQRLDHLMRTLPGPNGARWTNISMARTVAQLGTPVSAPYVSQLRSEVKTNPGANYVAAFAAALNVPITYLFGDHDTSEFERDLETVRALRAAGVQDLALLACGLGPEPLDTLRGLLRNFRRLSGLPEIRRPEAADRPGVSPELRDFLLP